MRNFVFLSLMTVFIALPAFAQESQDIPATQHQLWKSYFTKVAKGYKIVLDKEESKPLKVTDKPVHTYYTSGGGEYNHGSFFFWTRDGRPEAIGQLWCYGRMSGGSANVVHEMHSLAEKPFRAYLPNQNNVFWSPRRGGLSLQTLREDVASPKGSRGVRMAQMRAIARGFTGFVHRSAGKEELRMHQQPLFRYEANEAREDILDGAVFAFFSKWDPEVILVVEAFADNGSPAWRYSGVRLCNVPVSLERDDAEAWKVQQAPFRGGRVNGPNDPYYARHGVAVVDPVSLPAIDSDDNVR